MRLKVCTLILASLVIFASLAVGVWADCLCPGKKAPVLTVISITENHGLNTVAINTIIKGEGFNPKATVSLTKEGQPDIVGTNVKVNSATEIAATFDLKGKALGLWDVVVTNPKNKSAALKDGFTIEKPVELPVVQPVVQPVVVPKIGISDLGKLLKPVFFDYDKDNIRDDQVVILDKDLVTLKEFFKLKPEAFVVLGAHTDDRGSSDYNNRLSKRRAESVQKYLIANGINANQIIYYAYGKDYPVEKGNTESAWAFNRRVDVLVSETKLSRMEVLKQP